MKFNAILPIFLIFFLVSCNKSGGGGNSQYSPVPLSAGQILYGMKYDGVSKKFNIMECSLGDRLECKDANFKVASLTKNSTLYPVDNEYFISKEFGDSGRVFNCNFKEKNCNLLEFKFEEFYNSVSSNDNNMFILLNKNIILKCKKNGQNCEQVQLSSIYNGDKIFKITGNSKYLLALNFDLNEVSKLDYNEMKKNKLVVYKDVLSKAGYSKIEDIVLSENFTFMYVKKDNKNTLVRCKMNPDECIELKFENFSKKNFLNLYDNNLYISNIDMDNRDLKNQRLFKCDASGENCKDHYSQFLIEQKIDLNGVFIIK